MTLRKTSIIARLEQEHGKPLERIVRDTLASEGTISAAAAKVGVPLSTFYFWMLRLGIRTKTVTLIAS